MKHIGICLGCKRRVWLAALAKHVVHEEGITETWCLDCHIPNDVNYDISNELTQIISKKINAGCNIFCNECGVNVKEYGSVYMVEIDQEGVIIYLCGVCYEDYIEEMEEEEDVF